MGQQSFQQLFFVGHALWKTQNAKSENPNDNESKGRQKKQKKTTLIIRSASRIEICGAN